MLNNLFKLPGVNNIQTIFLLSFLGSDRVWFKCKNNSFTISKRPIIQPKITKSNTKITNKGRPEGCNKNFTFTFHVGPFDNFCDLVQHTTSNCSAIHKYFGSIPSFITNLDWRPFVCFLLVGLGIPVLFFSAFLREKKD